MTFPDVVDVEFTAYCNLKCGFCFGPVDDRSIPNLPTTFWENVLGWLAEYGAKGIVISGGEPTIHKDIVHLLRQSKLHGLSVVMSTHGQFRERVLACAPWTDWIALPVDGVTTSVLRTMRGKSWGVDNANALIEELRTAHPRIKIKLGTVANRQNHLEVPEIGAALYDKQVKINTWKIYQYTARRQFKHRWQGYHLPDDEFAALQSKIRNRIPDAPFNIVYSSNVSRGRAYVFVYPDGTVSIPNVGEKMEDLTLGNLYVEGRQVLDRVTGFCAENHWTNYHSTYPGSVTRTTGS